jgi:membrane protein required for colicin V production
MHPVDYAMLALLLISAIVGMFRGFLREVVALVTWIVALWAAWHFSAAVEPHLGGLLTQQPYRTWAARALIVLLVLLVGAAVGALLGHFARLSLFSPTDRFLGFLFGLLRGVVVLGLLVILGHYLQIDGEPWWRTSRLIPYAESVANAVRSVVGEDWVKRARDRAVSA